MRNGTSRYFIEAVSLSIFLLPVPNLFVLLNMKKEDASGIGFFESCISTSERRRGRADDVVGLRFKRCSSANSVFTALYWLDSTTHISMVHYTSFHKLLDFYTMQPLQYLDCFQIKFRFYEK